MNDRDADSGFTWPFVVGAGILGVALVYGAIKWPSLLMTTGLASEGPFQRNDQNALPVHPFAELLKMVVATLIGIIVTTVHKHYHRDKPLTRSLLQAQVLLCVAGALVMVIVGNSVARAFGVAGAAGIVRFRTPVEDPRDSTILFLLVGLGMACGVGLLEIAGLGAAFLCVVLVVLDRIGEETPRTMILSLVASGKDFPYEHVRRVLGASIDSYEPREVLQDDEVTVKYSVTMSPHTPLLKITRQLMAGDQIKSVSWQESKKGG